MKKITLTHLLCFFFLGALFGTPVLAELSQGLLESAENGKASAQYSIARSYELGKRVKSDKNKAIHWYSKAAEQGHVDAAYRLGLIYYRGIGGFKIDFKKALRYLSLAADKNHKNSQANLARMYANGDGVPRNEQLSDYWYEQAFTANTQSYDEYIKAQKQTNVKPNPIAANKPKPVQKPKKQKVIAAATPRVKQKKIAFPSTIMSTNWLQKGKASIYLKSSQTKCKLKNKKLVCSSSKLSGVHPTGIYKYKLRSIVSKGKSSKDINIQYRKLYTSVPEETIGGYDDDDDAETKTTQSQLVVGWEQRSHTIACRFESAKAILCRPAGADAFYIKSN